MRGGVWSIECGCTMWSVTGGLGTVECKVYSVGCGVGIGDGVV